MFYTKRGQVAERPHLNLPAGTYEEEIGIEGFFGPVSHLYHRNAPTSWAQLRKSGFQWPAFQHEPREFLKPECYRSLQKEVRGDFFSGQRILFWNDGISIHILKMTEATTAYFRNSDAHDLFFCHEGNGRLESNFGEFEFKKGDYVIVPRGVTYRLAGKDLYLLRIESVKSQFQSPEKGLLGHQALYHEEALRLPEIKTVQKESETVVRVQANGMLSEIVYPFDIRDIAGWCGNLYPYALSVHSIAPVMSPVAHLPPSVNSTFVTKEFVVCTFLPRPLEEAPGALKVPFFHSNIDFDEVIFYHEGDFFSRDNMGAGYITLHPRGINHGPHPKALKNQGEKTRTNEIAVMVDTRQALKVSSFARQFENTDYYRSW